MVHKLFALCFFLRIGSAFGQCGSSFAKLTVAILYDSKPGETSAELTNASTNGNATPLQIAKISNTLVSLDECVGTNTLYKIAFKDTGSDGIAGPGYASLSINDRLIATLSNFGSEAVYYFSADSQECGDPRWVLDVKYDTTPAAVSASMTNSGGALVFSLSGLNSAFMAGQFVHVERCLAPGSYTFSITAIGGISSPGFYRIFSENSLLAIGGGDNGFTGTQSTAFTVTDGPVPTAAPTPEICDDAWQEKFTDNEGLQQNCIYLSSRPQLIPSLCTPGSSAWRLCKETCGRCTDDCVDSDNKVKFVLDGKSGRTCEFVRVRLSADFAKNFPLFCDPANKERNAYNFCPESCNVCDGVVSGSGAVTPAPTPKLDPRLTDPCEDSLTTKIWINEEIGEQSCRYLQTNPELKAIYCQKNHPSFAYTTCEETCGKCTDDCEDTVGVTFQDKSGATRACSWLADDLVTRMPLYCSPGSVAWEKCKESCGNCL